MTKALFNRAPLRRLMSKGVAVLAAGAIASLQAVVPVLARGNVPVVRDAEIESLVRDYARPILKAAGLSKKGVEIVLVNDRSFNAFVAGRRLFINTGALMTAETPNEIIGVIAHEAGHIAGGHQERLRQQLERAQTLAVVGSLLGIGAMAAGAATNSRGLAGAGSGIALGSGEAAKRGLLAYQRGEEITADRSALQYLNATGQSAKGMIKTFERFASALALTGSRMDPYLVSHPMPRDRIALLEDLAKKSKFWNREDPADLQERHDLARVKIAAYTEGPGAVARIGRSLHTAIAGDYGAALNTYLNGNPREAVKRAEALVKKRPHYAFFQELLGDSFMKANRPAEAANAYGRAARLAGGSSLLMIAQGQALIATGRKDAMRQAIDQIRKGLTADPDNAGAYRFLAQAYGVLGDIGEAELASAEGNYHAGNLQDARVFAARAQQKLKRGSPAWQRAQDIIDTHPNKKK
ncbi:M48 family metalloprotease [Zhengella mangrovi]|nr:M48 family metalloprotease [Zhengella mangrovi]